MPSLLKELICALKGSKTKKFTSRTTLDTQIYQIKSTHLKGALHSHIHQVRSFPLQEKS